MVDLTPFYRLPRIYEREALKLRSVSRPLTSDEIEFLDAFDLYQDGLLGIVQLRVVGKKTIFKHCFSYGFMTC